MNSDCKETEVIVHLGYHLSSPGDSLRGAAYSLHHTPPLPHHLIYLSPSLPALWHETLPFRWHLLGFLANQLHPSQWNS